MTSASELQRQNVLNNSARRLPFSYEGWGPALAILDAGLIIATSIASAWVYSQSGSVSAPSVPSELRPLLGASFVLGALYLAIAHARGLYRSSSLLRNGAAIGKVFTSWGAVFLFGSLAAFLLKSGDQFSRGAILIYFASGGILLILGRYAAALMLSNAIKTGSLKRKRIALIRDPASPALHSPTGDMAHLLSQHGYEIVRSYSFNDLAAPARADCTFTCDDLLELNRNGSINEVIVCASEINPDRLTAIMSRLRRLPISVKLMPDPELDFFLQMPVIDVGPRFVIELQRRPCSAFEHFVKRSMDFTLSAIGLLALAPLLLMTAILIRIDSPGPVLFTQWRTGFSGRTFRIYKFRTMTTADDGDAICQAVRGDRRVTRVGAWLRSTSIDELPQLLNVLLGDMSLIGPRPHAVAHDVAYGKLLDNYTLRYRMLPGITGWAQVTGFRGETATTDLMAKRVEQDLWYIDNWSLSLDIQILLRTVYSIMRIRDVY